MLGSCTLAALSVQEAPTSLRPFLVQRVKNPTSSANKQKFMPLPDSGNAVFCRPYQDSYYCQAPQTPTYNFSDPNFAAQGPSTPPAASTGSRHLLQAPNNSSATNSTGAPVQQQNSTGNSTVACNKIAYYGPCGESPHLRTPLPSLLAAGDCSVEQNALKAFWTCNHAGVSLPLLQLLRLF